MVFLFVFFGVYRSLTQVKDLSRFAYLRILWLNGNKVSFHKTRIMDVKDLLPVNQYSYEWRSAGLYDLDSLRFYITATYFLWINLDHRNHGDFMTNCSSVCLYLHKLYLYLKSLTFIKLKTVIGAHILFVFQGQRRIMVLILTYFILITLCHNGLDLLCDNPM